MGGILGGPWARGYLGRGVDLRIPLGFVLEVNLEPGEGRVGLRKSHLGLERTSGTFMDTSLNAGHTRWAKGQICMYETGS